MPEPGIAPDAVVNQENGPPQVSAGRNDNAGYRATAALVDRTMQAATNGAAGAGVGGGCPEGPPGGRTASTGAASRARPGRYFGPTRPGGPYTPASAAPVRNLARAGAGRAARRPEARGSRRDRRRRFSVCHPPAIPDGMVSRIRAKVITERGSMWRGSRPGCGSAGPAARDGRRG
jgi:hypothetical protein